MCSPAVRRSLEPDRAPAEWMFELRPPSLWQFWDALFTSEKPMADVYELHFDDKKCFCLSLTRLRALLCAAFATAQHHPVARKAASGQP